MMESSNCDPTLERRLHGHNASVNALYYNANKQVVSGSMDSMIRVWDLRINRKSFQLSGHIKAVTDVSFNQKGDYLASASRDRSIRIWEASEKGQVSKINGHVKSVLSIQFIYNGDQILSSSEDETVKLWATSASKLICTYSGHTNAVKCARMSADNSIIASCSEDKSIRFWNQQARDCIATYKTACGYGSYIAWHPTNHYLGIATTVGTVELYDVRLHKLLQQYCVHEKAVSQVAFHPSGEYIITASKDGYTKVIDLLHHRHVYTLMAHQGAVNAVKFSASGNSFASAGQDKLVCLWKTNFTRLIHNSNENVAGSSTNSIFQAPTTPATQGGRVWYLCYHSNKLPATAIVLKDDREAVHNTINNDSFNEGSPNANSTLNNPISNIHTDRGISTTYRVIRHSENTSDIATPINRTQSECSIWEGDLNDVGDISHIPRVPPSQVTYTIPSIMETPRRTIDDKDDNLMFGMIKLRDNDVCYTSGTIEWVGKKRSYPINSGFKVMNAQGNLQRSYPKMRKLNMPFSKGISNLKDCDCADVLPTINAIVDHLNALHEAVDLVDLRLNTLEHTPGENH